MIVLLPVTKNFAVSATSEDEYWAWKYFLMRYFRGEISLKYLKSIQLEVK